MNTFTPAELQEIKRADKYELKGELTSEDFQYVAVLERESKRLRHALGIHTTNKKRVNPNKNPQMIIDMTAKGLTPKEISEKTGYNKAYVYNFLRLRRKYKGEKDI